MFRILNLCLQNGAENLEKISYYLSTAKFLWLKKDKIAIVRIHAHAMFFRNYKKNPVVLTGFSRNWRKFFDFFNVVLIIKGFKMIYHSTQSDDYLWYLILRGK